MQYGDITINVETSGHGDGRAVVFSNSLGTDLTLWDKVVERLPETLRLVRYDKRGHGASSVPPAPYTMDDLVDDAEGMIDALGLKEIVFVGLSIGGMIGQGLAARRPELLRGLVLSNTAARIGTPAVWQDRVDAIRARGLAGIADGVLERWFGPAFLASDELPHWREMLIETPAEGYIGCCQAIAGSDLTASTAALNLPVLAIAGSLDGATPPDLVRESAALVPGARFEIVEDAGHLPCVESPDRHAALITEFLKEVGYV